MGCPSTRRRGCRPAGRSSSSRGPAGARPRSAGRRRACGRCGGGAVRSRNAPRRALLPLVAGGTGRRLPRATSAYALRGPFATQSRKAVMYLVLSIDVELRVIASTIARRSGGSRSRVRASACSWPVSPGCGGRGRNATSAGRTMRPASSTHRAKGTLVMPKSSTSRWDGSTNDGCVGLALSWNGRAASTSVSRATVTTVRPAGSSSAWSACHPGSSNRQPHHEAHARSKTLRPRRPPTSNVRPSKSGRAISGKATSSSTRPPPRGRGPTIRGSRRPPTACPCALRTGARRCCRPSEHRGGGRRPRPCRRPAA